MKNNLYSTIKEERALLVMIELAKEKWPVQSLAQEFKNLVVSTGISAQELVVFKRKEITPSLFIGKGKAQELAVLVQEKNINVVIFNNNLSFTQQRNLEEVFGVKTIDRTQLILDIFAAHARTREGILQVELAQLEYLMPRLAGKGIALSRLGGGIGTRGPGEKKLEVDRRKIADRIVRLKKEIEGVRQHRLLLRKKRQKEKVNMCSLVGYTNAGKSTLFNALTKSEERTAQSLFTTLDTVSRKFAVHNNLEIVLSDTVGFIYKLPPYLIESFKATLEELHYADVLLHIIDSSSKEISRLLESVNSILKELELNLKPAILIFNKIDELSGQQLADLKRQYPDAVFISALREMNLNLLNEKIYEGIFGDLIEGLIKVPFNQMAISSFIHNNCEVLKVDYSQGGVIYLVRITKKNIDFLRKKGVNVKEV
ncbi:MAG: GTPase HflX [Candidatus Omnitrophota bacterium]|nr:MAG: GTPase HflX [Candidatus Omnitrophota bacterium]